ncbi:metallophosphoesterase family protein [Agreia pratensis]|uniref:Calcineurin-like phosphoesterase n=1 Tax=Agreia pratensis TaxID=150121 RepID=A0A1X7KHD4_9MICO|nr:metallophosphoesterase [Agreia pratensis]SMG40405.1 Calcineurin-like phosphoesterase [Agreia pratensis]
MPANPTNGGALPVIAHLSDPHLDLSPGRSRRLRAVLDLVRDLPFVDGLLVTGDLADHGAATEYAEFFGALPDGLPTLVVPGNHDLSAPLLAALSDAGRGQTLSGTLDLDGVRIVGMDTHVDARDDGFLAPESIADARDRIASAPGHVVLAMHHPPVPVGHDLADSLYRLTNPEALEELVAEHDQVIGIFTGHVHSALATTFSGVPLLGAPGIVSTMRLGSKTDPIADTTAMPGFALHTIDSTHIRTVFHHLSPSAL